MIVSVVTIPAFVAVLVRLVGRPRIIAIERNLLQLVFVEVRLLNTDCAGAITTSIKTVSVFAKCASASTRNPDAKPALAANAIAGAYNCKPI